MGLAGWLTLVFVVSKILGYIDWSWWLVFSPFIIVVLLQTVINSVEKNGKR